MELRDLRLALHRHWVVAAIAFLACLGVGIAAAYVPAKTYRATAVVLATPAPTAGGNLVQVASFQIPAIIETIQSRAFIERVARELPEGLPGDLDVSARSDPGTGILRISAEGGDPNAVAVWATALARTVVTDATSAAQLAAVDPTVPPPLVSLQSLGEARPPQEAVAPQPVPILVGSFVIAVIAALLAAVGASRARRALDVGDEVRRRLGAPVLGQIPAVRRLRRSSRSVPDVLQDGPSQLVEAFQGLRTNVELAFHGERPPAVAVASWTSGEGKSTVVAGLAISLANVGRDVVVVDGDLRRPTAHLKLGEPFGEGLADAARVDPASLVLPTRFEHLSFMPAGIPDRHPADVLAVALPRAVAALSAEGRLVLIDAPPLNGVAEAPLVASVARHVIVVVDAANSNLDDLEQSVARLRAAGVVVVGLVINRARRGMRLRAYERTGVPEPGDRVGFLRPVALSSADGDEAATPVAGPR